MLRPVPPAARTWILVILAVLGLTALSVRLSRTSPVDRVLVISSPLDSRGTPVGAGLEVLLSDALEVLSGATVTHAGQLPSTGELRGLPPDMRLLRATAARVGDQLSLTLEWTTVARCLDGKPWTREAIPAQEPLRALARATERWPLPIRHHSLADLVPRSPERFWLLLEGMAIQDDEAATRRLPVSQKLAEDEPHCAAAWATLGDHLYRSLWVNPDRAGIGLNSRTHQAFRRAVERIPGYPRATFLWSLMLTDTGNQGLALKNLQEAVRLRPGCPDLYHGLAYAGRTSGLLEGARRALARRRDLLGPLATPSSWFAETTYLYLGDREAFAQDVARAAVARQDASILFYQGYLALLRGDRERALAAVVRGSDPAMTPSLFRDLCRVYRAYLEGRSRDGLADLKAIDEVRGKLRIPDGEWTFKEAEAYALLGDADRGVDCATRAFVQGFSCAPWYETSPFLASVREHPRWPTLRRNIRERQAVLNGTFPPASFAL